VGCDDAAHGGGDEVAAHEAYAVLAEVWAGADAGVSAPTGSGKSGNFIPRQS